MPQSILKKSWIREHVTKFTTAQLEFRGCESSLTYRGGPILLLGNEYLDS